MPYIGNQPGTGVRNRFIYTATASQTTFTGADNNGKTLKYADSDFVDVFLNGVCLVPVTDYTSTSKTSIVLVQAASLNDTLEVIAYDIATISDTVSKADGGTFEANVTFADGADIITATAGTDNVRLGENAGDSIASGGNNNVVIGKDAGTALTTGDNNVAIGYEALKTEDADSNTVAVGYQALATQNAGSDVGNTAVGTQAGTALTTGSLNTFVGRKAGATVTTHSNNVAIGAYAMDAGVGDHNIAIGSGALGGASLASGDNVAIGTDTLNALTSGTENVCIGRDAGKGMMTGSYNTVLGNDALVTEDGHGKNVAVGWSTLKNLNSGVTGLDGENVAVGYDAGRNTNLGVYNTFVGSQAGQANTAGDNNTFIGRGSGSAVTTGDNNTILGRFNGNQARADGATLDIRTSDNNIVLSDGAGNPRCYWDSAGTMRNINDQSAGFNAYFKNDHSSAYVLGVETGSSSLVFFYGSGGAGVGTITTNGSTTSYNTSSDYRLKENVVDITGATERLKQLQPRRFNFIGNTDLGTVDGFLAHEAQTVVPEAVTGTHNQTEAIGDVTDGDGNTIETGVVEPDTLKEGHTWAETGTRPVYQGIDHGKLVPLLVATIKELEARIAALEAG